MRAIRSAGQSVAVSASASCSGDNLVEAPGGPNRVGAARGYVVLLEDDVDQANLVCRWLALENVPCRWFRSALELYALFEASDQDPAASRPRLLICDWHLADTDADTVLATLRTGSGLPCPVVVISAHTDPARRAAALDAGASAWLSKPVAREALRTMLARYG